jgi:hypothetical protein
MQSMTRKQKIWFAVFTILFAITIGVIFHFSQQAYVKLDRDSQILYSTIAFSAIGLVIVAIRERKGIDKNYVEAMEVLILIIIPTTDAIYLFKNPINNLTWAFVPYFVVIISWFGFFIRRIYKKSEIKDANILNRELLNEIDKRKKRKTALSLTVWWCLLMLYGVTAVWLSVQVIPIFSHQSS